MSCSEWLVPRKLQVSVFSVTSSLPSALTASRRTPHREKMGRAPCCDKANVKKGPWSPEEDAKLRDYIEKQGTGGNWIALPRKAGILPLSLLQLTDRYIDTTNHSYASHP